MTLRGWLGDLLGYHTVVDEDDTEYPSRGTLKVANATIQDDAANDRTIVTPGTSGGPGGGVTNLQGAYNGGGQMAVTVASAANLLRVIAADITADVLLRFRRNVTGADGEQTRLKAPDATVTGIDGTRLDLVSGAGFDGTGSTNGSDAGDVRIRGGTGGSAVTGSSGDGGALDFEAGAGGSHTGATGQPAVGGVAGFKAGDGGASSDDAVDGADGGDAEIDAGAGGSGTGGETGSAAGLSGVVRVGQRNGTARASGVEVGFGATTVKSGASSGITAHYLRGTASLGHDVAPTASVALDINRSSGGTIKPLGVLGLPSYEVSGGEIAAMEGVAVPPDRSVLYNASTKRIELYSDGARRSLLDSRGGTLAGPIVTTPSAVAFSGTPSFDLDSNDDFVLGQITSDFAITLSNPGDGKSGEIAMVQDGTGGYKITGVTVSGYTVTWMHDGAPVNTPAFKLAGARSVLRYKLCTINGVAICALQISSDGAATPDYA